MSTSLLYHGFSIVGYRYIWTNYREVISHTQYRGRGSIFVAQYVKANESLSMVLYLVGFTPLL